MYEHTNTNITPYKIVSIDFYDYKLKIKYRHTIYTICYGLLVKHTSSPGPRMSNIGTQLKYQLQFENYAYCKITVYFIKM